MQRSSSAARLCLPARTIESHWVLILAFSVLLCGARLLAEPRAVGTVAPDFKLKTPEGTTVQLSKWSHGHMPVVVILRGFPGYQCPYCQKQVHDFVSHASDFAAKGAAVLLVYPGTTAGLGDRAKEFLAKQDPLPANIILVTDPDYEVTNLYGVRWNAPNETAYPSTFILDGRRKILFERISQSHGDRVSAQEALDQLPSR
jgi:thioredoxin-dependent peroxiredoxin